MYDAKKLEEKSEKKIKYSCICERSYYRKSQDGITSVKSLHVPTNNIFY